MNIPPNLFYKIILIKRTIPNLLNSSYCKQCLLGPGTVLSALQTRSFNSHNNLLCGDCASPEHMMKHIQATGTARCGSAVSGIPGSLMPEGCFLTLTGSSIGASKLWSLCLWKCCLAVVWVQIFMSMCAFLYEAPFCSQWTCSRFLLLTERPLWLSRKCILCLMYWYHFPSVFICFV